MWKNCNFRSILTIIIGEFFICYAQYEDDPSLKKFKGILEAYSHTANEVVFLLDESGSIGIENFPGILNFTEMVARFLSVSEKHSRVAVVTFATLPRTHINYIENEQGNNMCTFLDELTKIDYVGDYTYTGDAMVVAQNIFKHSRKNSNKIIILMTDGRSNGGRNLKEISEELKNEGVIIFAVGIADVNEDELFALATSPDHIYIMKDLEYILHLNVKLRRDTVETSWDYAKDASLCNGFCSKGYDCCDDNADCRCGTKGGNHECVCRAGFEGVGGKGHCVACPKGTFKEEAGSAPCSHCPGNSTTLKEGGTSLKDCVCLSGYEGHPHYGKACKAVRCAKLVAPFGGITFPKNCGHTYGSQCTFKCNEGYCPYACNNVTLLSNAVTYPWNILPDKPRQCLETGTWSGDDFHCEKMKCPNLIIPKHGTYNCSHSDFTFDTVCNISCRQGYTLMGSNIRQCLISGAWTGEETICKADLCPPLKTNEKLRVKPRECGKDSMEYNFVCQYHCRKGFKLALYTSSSKSAGERQCLAGGKWSNEHEKLYCRDAELPTIVCPASIETPTDGGKPSALVYWNLPDVSDNVAVDSYELFYPKNIRKPPYAFPIGVTKIVYRVLDSSGLINNCSFTVTVKDNEPPRVIYCPPNIIREHGKKSGVSVHWKEPEFKDNSGNASILDVNRKSGSLFSWGPPSEVKYRISDRSGNTVNCSFTVTVKAYSCPYMPPPTNGLLACDTWSGGQFCKVACEKNYIFITPPESVYYCRQKTKQWTKHLEKGPLILPWPDCARVQDPQGLNVSATATYSVTSCNEEDIDRVKREFIKTAKSRRFCPPKAKCDIKNVNVTCSSAERLRTKKSVSKLENLFTQEFQQFGLLRTRREAGGASLSISYNVEIESPTSESNSTEDCADCSTIDELIESERDITEHLKADIDEVVKKEFEDHSPVSADFQVKKAILCKLGSVLKNNNTCVACPAGTFFDKKSKSCKVCSKDHYQDKEGSLECKKCPQEKLTLYTKAKTLDDCKSPCSPGSFSDSGMESCRACPKGTYMDAWGSKNCFACPYSLTTNFFGASSKDNCVSPCGFGTYSEDGFPPCAPCPKGTYQHRLQSTSCVNCPNGTTTIVENADRIDFCQTFYFCKDYRPCMNSATCLDLENGYKCVCPEGFAGDHCGMNINDCDTEACLNGGICHDGINNFTCSCPSGFSGFRCEFNDDDCHSDLCQNGGTCEDLVNEYQCHCPDGFVGKHCEINQNDCDSSPCKNNGTCFDSKNDFRCCCLKGFTGHTCEIKVDNCENIQCLNGGLCHSSPDGFICSCSEGFEGRFCEININDCFFNPCNNGGTCIDGINNATCLCSDLFSGPTCETALPMEFSINFPSPMTSNYVKLFNTHRLSAITISFFMRTDYVHKDNQGTPFSYTFQDPNSNSFHDNAMTLMNTNKLMVYIQGELFHSNHVANSDSYWHHYAIVWENVKGSWAFYVDGDVVLSGTDIAKKKYLHPGVFILGQDQDSLGSSFSISESFVGEISEFNVWDYSFTSEEISQLKSSCGFLGNIIRWPVAQKHTFGDVLVDVNFNFCSIIGVCTFSDCYCRIDYENYERDHICKHSVADCASNPCENAQSCIENGNASFCDCDYSFDGRLCEHDVDECLVENGLCEHVCINSVGSYECECPDGKILSSGGHTCVDTSICRVGDKVYSNGEIWLSICEECRCVLGNITCLEKPCPNVTCHASEELVMLPGECCKSCLSRSVCTIKNDNELTTFDSAVFNVYGNCLYVLTKDHISSEFSVYVQAGEDNACRWSIVMHVLCSKIDISANGSVKLDEVKVFLPYKDDQLLIEAKNSSVLIQTRFGVSVAWSCSENVSISVPSSYKKQLSGLCGNFNDKFQDDLTTADKVTDDVVTKLLQRWKIDSPYTCTETGLDELEITNLKKFPLAERNIEFLRQEYPWLNLYCSNIKRDSRKRLLSTCQRLWKRPFSLCHKYVNPSEYYIMCLQDVCGCSYKDTCFCDSMLAYSMECANYDVSIKYLEAVKSCTKYCPYGMVYKECGPVCPATCSYEENESENCERARCVPGCYCPADKLLHDGSCISKGYCDEQKIN